MNIFYLKCFIVNFDSHLTNKIPSLAEVLNTLEVDVLHELLQLIEDVDFERR